jgi:hypothetical protein
MEHPAAQLPALHTSPIAHDVPLVRPLTSVHALVLALGVHTSQPLFAVAAGA